MNLLVNPRIHIAPIGFEIDRVVMPAKEMKADIVYMLVHNNVAADKSTGYAQKIQQSLKRSKIAKIGRAHV